jgi:hypothetical protein
MDDSDGFINEYDDETDKVRRKKNKVSWLVEYF